MNPARPAAPLFRPLICCLLAAVGSIFASSAWAQSCILTRLDSPVVNAFDPSILMDLEESRWEVSVAWRYGKAARHFVGTEEQHHRREENSQVENDVNLLDLGVRYRFSAQTDLQLGIPYLMAVRSGPIRNEEREVVSHEVRSNTRGIGDMTLLANHLLWDPVTHPRSNISVGGGLKFPTGANSLVDSRLRENEAGDLVPTVETADQSVQPGDGGWGLVAQASGFRLLNATGTFAAYGSATYVFAPETESGTYTYRSRPSEAIMSIADQYAGRIGLQVAIAGTPWTVGLGGRIEGIPAEDVFGSSEGFRRPGYIISAEPSASWTKGKHTLSMSAPIAVQRNRQRSVSDKLLGRHGDASFPDFIVLFGYSRRL